MGREAADVSFPRLSLVPLMFDKLIKLSRRLLSHSFIMSTLVLTPSEIYPEVFPCLCVFSSKLPSTACEHNPTRCVKQVTAATQRAEAEADSDRLCVIYFSVQWASGSTHIEERSSKCVIITDFNFSPDSSPYHFIILTPYITQAKKLVLFGREGHYQKRKTARKGCETTKLSGTNGGELEDIFFIFFFKALRSTRERV